MYKENILQSDWPYTRTCVYYIHFIQRQENEKYNNIIFLRDIMYVNTACVALTRNRRRAKRFRKKSFLFFFSITRTQNSSI